MPLRSLHYISLFSLSSTDPSFSDDFSLATGYLNIFPFVLSSFSVYPSTFTVSLLTSSSFPFLFFHYDTFLGLLRLTGKSATESFLGAKCTPFIKLKGNSERKALGLMHFLFHQLWSGQKVSFFPHARFFLAGDSAHAFQMLQIGTVSQHRAVIKSCIFAQISAPDNLHPCNTPDAHFVLLIYVKELSSYD